MFAGIIEVQVNGIAPGIESIFMTCPEPGEVVTKSETKEILMSVEGIWTSQVYGLFGWENNGVLIFDNGKVMGGGNNHFAVGSYSESGKKVEILLDIEYHGTPKTVFGAAENQLKVVLQGKQDDEGMIGGEVFRADKRKLSLAFRLVRRADLP